MKREAPKVSADVKPLAIAQQILTWLCVLPAHESTSKLKKLTRLALVSALILSDSTTFVWALMYAVTFFSVDFQGFSVALYAAIAAIPMANSIAVAFLHRHKNQSIFANLAKIYDKSRNDDDSFYFLAETNNKSEWLWNLYIKFAIAGIVITITVLAIISVLICYLRNGYFDAKQSFSPYKFLLPWNQSTLIGYIGEIMYSIYISVSYMVYMGAVLLPFISICLHHQAFYKMFRHSIHKINHCRQDKRHHQLLCGIVEFHTSIKNWFSETAALYDPHLMVQLVCNMLMLVMPVYQLDQLFSKQFDINMFTFDLLCVSVCLPNLFLCCFLGKLASESYVKMADNLYVCNWYELPLELQKYFIVMIANAQLPLHYHGYGLITLDLEAFTNLMKKVYTYFMILKTLSTNSSG